MRNLRTLCALAMLMAVLASAEALAEDEDTKEKGIVKDVLDGGGIELMKGVSMGVLIETEGHTRSREMTRPAILF